MQRRAFSVLGLTSLSLLPSLSQAQAKKFAEGTDYVALDKPLPVDAPPGKVDVVEFFWYSCPHCNAFEPRLEAWLKHLPADIAFRRVPIAFRDSFVPQQKLFYALEALGKVDEMQAKVFNAIHTEHQNLDGDQAITAWIEKQGINKAKFLEQFNSFSVASKVRKAKQLQEDFKINGVPSFGVAGRFYIDGELAKSMDRALEVVEFLAAEERRRK